MQHAHAQDQTYLFDTLEDGLVGVSTSSCKWAYFWKDGASPLLDFLCLQVGGKGEERYSKMTERKVLGPHTGGNFKPKTKRAIMSVVGTAWWKQVGAQRKVKNKNEKNPRSVWFLVWKQLNVDIHTFAWVRSFFTLGFTPAAPRVDNSVLVPFLYFVNDRGNLACVVVEFFLIWGNFTPGELTPPLPRFILKI